MATPSLTKHLPGPYDESIAGTVSTMPHHRAVGISQGMLYAIPQHQLYRIELAYHYSIHRLHALLHRT